MSSPIVPFAGNLPVFDFTAFVDAFDTERRARGLDWYEFADELWDQSEDLNAQRPDDHSLCGGAVSRLRNRGEASCQYALFMPRWLGRAPEDFLTSPVVDGCDTRLPEAGPDSRLRWNLSELHTAVDERRHQCLLALVVADRGRPCSRPARQRLSQLLRCDARSHWPRRRLLQRTATRQGLRLPQRKECPNGHPRR